MEYPNGTKNREERLAFWWDSKKYQVWMNRSCSAASATVYYNAQGCSRLLKVVVALRVAAMIGLGFLAGGPILSVPHEATRAACGMFGSIELPLSFTVRLS